MDNENQLLNERSRNDEIRAFLRELSMALQAVPLGEAEALAFYARRIEQSDYSTAVIREACQNLQNPDSGSEFERRKFPPLADIRAMCAKVRRDRHAEIVKNCPECEGMGLHLREQADGYRYTVPCARCSSPKGLDFKGDKA